MKKKSLFAINNVERFQIMIGETISHYKILEKLGEGGMGVVYKAQDTKLDRTVALKFLPPQVSINEDEKKRFIHEAKAAAALDHPNICSVYEIDETENSQMFIVMAYYEGETLKEKIERGRIETEQVIKLAIQLSGGLQEAHANHIIHRDIKSANIIITNKGQAKILDFGLAKLRGQTRLTRESTTLGTAAYMSPEQSLGEEVDERTDIWSLGVVLYEIITGQLPFKGEYEQAVIYSILNEEPEYPSKINYDIPPQLEKIILKALHKDPKKRFQSMGEMDLAIRNALEVSQTEERKKRIPVFRLGRKQRRLFYRILPAAIAVFAAIVYFGLFRKAAIGPKSIAILPLTSINDQAEQDWFTDGMTDALITSLAKIKDLRVTSRTSVMRFKESLKTASEIARELKVSYIIEGTVLRMNNQIKITTRLIDPIQDEYLWAQDYERDLTDILSLQGDVARAIAAKIEVTLTPKEEHILTARKKVVPAAYEAYLKGIFYYYKLTRKSLDTSLKYFELAAELDPEYAPAYAGIALVWGGRSIMGFIPFREAQKKSAQAAARAMELDSTLVEVRYMKAVFFAWYEWKFDLALREFKEVIKMNPNMAEAHAYYSQVLFMFNRPEEAMNQINQALELDPFNNLLRSLYAMDLMYAHRYDEVIDSMEKVLESSPEEYIALSTLRSAYHQKKMFDDALRIWRQSFKVRKDDEAIEILNKGNDEGGYSMALKRVAELMIVRRERGIHVTPWQIATLYTRAGMLDEALSWFEKAFEAHDPNMPYLKIDPIFDNLRKDPRFIMLLKKMGLDKNELKTKIQLPLAQHPYSSC